MRVRRRPQGPTPTPGEACPFVDVDTVSIQVTAIGNLWSAQSRIRADGYSYLRETITRSTTRLIRSQVGVLKPETSSHRIEEVSFAMHKELTRCYRL